jgi:aminopeptidase N
MRRAIVQAAATLVCIGLSGATIAAPSTGALATGEVPFSFDAAPGRLPKNVVPIDYTIDVAPDVKSMTLSGSESILLQMREATTTIQFNSLNEVLKDVKLDGKSVKSVASDEDQQLTTVTLTAPADAGQHELTFAYSGKIESTGQGLFAQKYTQPREGVMLSTQFEATDARRMFPCWDEPAFRSTYELRVRIPAAWTAVSNMPIATRTVAGEVATVAFMRTPKMPSYLVEFTAGDIASISAKADGYEFSVWTVRGREHDGETALKDAQTILADYNDYFGYRFPLPKLDSIAVPGGFSGAMENWGAITYNDQLLLVTPASTLGDRQQVFAVQAHEMAHQWNGDLVTMGWWDDIWLNESFASWMAAKETAQRHPDWKWWEGQDDDREGAMRADARASSHAVHSHVTDELQVNNAFDPQITYSKGQAILRMFEAYLGPVVFRDGIRGYLKDRAYSNATSADLWNALNTVSAKKVGEIASGWTEQPGFPLIKVSAKCDSNGARTISLTQKRFLLGGGADPKAMRWKVPLQLRVGEATGMQSVLLSADPQSVPAGRCGEALSVNANAIGYYRTQYDAATLASDTRNFARMPDGDRIALLDDQWALVTSNMAELPSYLALASSMGSDFDPRAWQQIVDALGTVEYAERGTRGHDAYTRYASSILKPAMKALGWDPKDNESPSVQELRRNVIAALGLWGDQAVLAEARRRYALFLKDHHAVKPDYQGVILDIVAHYADAATFDQLHALAKGATDEAELERYYGALMRVGDAALAEKAAKIAVSDEIPPQADNARLHFVMTLSPEHQLLSWRTFTTNSEMIMKSATTFGPLIIAQYVPEGFWSGVPLSDVESWVRAHVPAEMSDVVDRGMESARFRLAQKTVLVRQADSYLQRGG